MRPNYLILIVLGVPASLAVPFLTLTARRSDWWMFHGITFAPGLIVNDTDTSRFVLRVLRWADYFKYSIFTDYIDSLRANDLKIYTQLSVNGRSLGLYRRAERLGDKGGYLMLSPIDLQQHCACRDTISATIDDVSRSHNGFEIDVSLTCPPNPFPRGGPVDECYYPMSRERVGHFMSLLREEEAGPVIL